MRRWLIVAAAVAAIGLAAVVVGGAATSAQEGDGPIGTFLGKVAEKLGVSEEELQSAVQEAQIEMIDEAVADGRLTEEQAQRLKERVEAGQLPLGPLLGDGLRGSGLCLRGPGHIVEAAAQVLDMPREELVQQLKEGNSLAKVAEEQGMSVDEFEAALVAQVEADLEEKVADGTITQEQAGRISEGLEERIDRIVHAQPKTLGHCRPGHGPGHGGFGPWHGPAGDEDEAEQTSEVTA